MNRQMILLIFALTSWLAVDSSGSAYAATFYGGPVDTCPSPTVQCVQGQDGKWYWQDVNDPYEGYNTTTTLKPVLLRRISNDPSRLTESYETQYYDPATGISSTIKVPDPGFQEPNTYYYRGSHLGNNFSWWNRNHRLVGQRRNPDGSITQLTKKYPQGALVTTSNPEKLNELFKNVANRIKLKLVR